MMSKFGDGDKPDGSGSDDGFGTEPSAEGTVCVMAQLVYGDSFCCSGNRISNRQLHRSNRLFDGE